MFLKQDYAHIPGHRLDILNQGGSYISCAPPNPDAGFFGGYVGSSCMYFFFHWSNLDVHNCQGTLDVIRPRLKCGHLGFDRNLCCVE